MAFRISKTVIMSAATSAVITYSFIMLFIAKQTGKEVSSWVPEHAEVNAGKAVMAPVRKLTAASSSASRSENIFGFSEQAKSLDKCLEGSEAQRRHAFRGLFGENIKPDDPRLIAAIRHHLLDAPRPFLPKFSLPLFETPQAKEAMRILNKKNGFFVECGGLDGERSSNTIALESNHGWNGLLVEMDPSWYLQLRGKNRRAHSANTCLSPHAYPVETSFREHSMGQGQLVEGGGGGSNEISVVCVPLYSLMLALNTTKIDYFSLDVEGFELPILRSIPYDLLDISVINVEYVHGSEGEQAYIDFLVSKGYRLHKRIKEHKPEIYFGCNDFVFVKESLLR